MIIPGRRDNDFD